MLAYPGREDEYRLTGRVIYRKQPGRWLVLYIDQDKLTAPVRYEDPAEIYPHIYGPLNRDAIVAVREVGRAPDGTFLMPSQLE